MSQEESKEERMEWEILYGNGVAKHENEEADMEPHSNEEESTTPKQVSPDATSEIKQTLQWLANTPSPEPKPLRGQTVADPWVPVFGGAPRQYMEAAGVMGVSDRAVVASPAATLPWEGGGPVQDLPPMNVEKMAKDFGTAEAALHAAYGVSYATQQGVSGPAVRPRHETAGYTGRNFGDVAGYRRA